MRKKFIFLALLLVVTIFVENASALHLPESSYMDGAWEGVLNYVDEDLGFDVGIAYSVYDAYNLEFQSQEEAFVSDVQDELGLEGQYIYGYQLFNRPNDAEGEYTNIGYFGLLELDETPVDESLINGDTTAMDDQDGGLAPYTPSLQQGTWGFTESVLANGEKSWILVFSSEYAPGRGTYTITSSPPPNLPIPEVPEPATIALLGLGGIVFFKKRRTSK
jgi:hypothetical protein